MCPEKETKISKVKHLRDFLTKKYNDVLAGKLCSVIA
jgi:Ca2+-binding EF-hand superfamily protein